MAVNIQVITTSSHDLEMLFLSEALWPQFQLLVTEEHDMLVEFHIYNDLVSHLLIDFSLENIFNNQFKVIKPMKTDFTISSLKERTEGH